MIVILRKLILYALCLLLLSWQKVYCQPKKDSQTKEQFKVISYNIWNGFDWGKDVARKEKTLSWIKSQNADVVALQELCGYTKEQLKQDAMQWGHAYVEILKTDGYPVGITSNKPIETKERIFDKMHHGALFCRTWDIDFVVVHLSPFSHAKRNEEANIILERLNEGVEKGCIVLGDFNAVSPFDADLYKTNSTLIPSMKESEKKHMHVQNLHHGQLEYGAISKFLSLPLIDLVQMHTSGLDQRISCPSQVFEDKPGVGRHPESVRIDYILASPKLAKVCVNAKVANLEETYYLSDHYPVVVELKLPELNY